MLARPSLGLAPALWDGTARPELALAELDEAAYPRLAKLASPYCSAKSS